MTEEKTLLQEKTIVERTKEELDKRYTRTLAVAASNLCVHCGLCVDQCHYYMATQDPTVSPVAKAEHVRRVVKSEHDWLRKVFPWWTGATELTEAELDRWVEVAFRDCTMCQRCLVNCPMGVDTPLVLQTARGVLTAIGKAPEILVELADAAIAREENLEFFKEFYLEQIRGMEEELRAKVGDPEARIPVDVQGAKILYVPLSGAHTIMPAAEIFYHAGESWTLSMFEAANYGIFLQDPVRAKRITERVVREAERLGVEQVVITECGHAYAVARWEAPKWFADKPFSFKVLSILEVMDDYIQTGRIKVDPSRNQISATYHDSCNLGRNGGVFEEPRRILRACVSDFREMTPNRRQSICCGGGGGLVALMEYEETRLKAGKPKADQIRATGAEAVVASCDNCRHQLGEINEHYELGVKVMGMAELVANAIVPKQPEQELRAIATQSGSLN
jgi:Fe-S oxidoreductase